MNQSFGVIHIIKPGEDLNKISRLYQVSTQKILSYNPTLHSTPAIGNRVFIPRESNYTINKTDIHVNINGESINTLPVFLYKDSNGNNLYIPVTYLSKLGIDVDTVNNLIFIKNNKQLTNKIEQLENINYELKVEINRLKSFPEDIPLDTNYDHIFGSNSEFFVYYGKKRFTDVVENDTSLKELVEVTQSDGLRVNWVYYPAANQIYMYVSFINQRLGLNNYEGDKVHNLMGKAYENLHNNFDIITKDKSIRLEISFIFLESIEGYDVQRSIYINENNVNDYIKNTRRLI